VCCAPALRGASPDLPGPGLDVPVDADGDGASTYGDRHAFNYWLELGGSLADALASAEFGKDVIDLSEFFDSPDALLCGTCREFSIDDPENDDAAFAIDAVREAKPGFGAPEDLIYSVVNDQGVQEIRMVATPIVDPPPQALSCDSMDPETPTVLFTLSNVKKVWGLAVGSFNGAGTYGVYFVGEAFQFGIRNVRRLVYQGGTYSHQFFASLTGAVANAARTIEFDPVSGDLFVSEDAAVSQSGGNEARIWRINASGTVRLFGKNFNKPNGLTFHPSGVMLVAEEAPEPDKGNVLAVGGWRNLFRRGDANGDGIVNITDGIKIANWLSQSGPLPACLDGADADDNSEIEPDDYTYLYQFLFNGGPAPPAPGPYTCGRDPSADLLECLQSAAGCAIQ
jgi:hypothetical protein